MNYFFCVVILFLFSCNTNNNTVSFQWLEGKWEGKINDSMLIFEEWNTSNDKILSGTGGMCVKNDTVFAEKIFILKKDNNYYYRAEVKENEQPVDFAYMQTTNDSIVFENTTHDFPQRIVYYYKTAGKLYAHIDGTIKGKYRKEIFEYDKK